MLAELKKRVVLSPEDAPARIALARELLRCGQAEEAAAQAERALALAPDDIDAQRLLGAASLAAGRFPLAERACREVVQRQPTDAAAREALGEVFVREGRLDDALLHLREAAELEPTRAARFARLGELLAARGLLDAARLSLERALALDGSRSETQRVLREVRLALGDPWATADEDVRALGVERLLGRTREALAEAPLRDAVHNGPLAAAAAALRRDDVAEAKRQLVLLPEATSESADAEFLRGELCLALRDAPRAETAYARCLAADPGRGLAHARLGQLLLARGALEPALPHLENASRLRPSDCATRMLLGDALTRLDRRREAIAVFDALRTCDPTGIAALKLAALRSGDGARADTPGTGRIFALGWNALGGAASLVEALAVPGSGTLVLSGNVGRTGEEAAKVAHTCLRNRSEALGIAGRVGARDLHLHFVDTEYAKDGPSAGLALFLAGLSAFRGRCLPEGLAATGEITPQGAVRPVGGVREKIVAASICGLRLVLVPRRNLFDIRELPPEATRRTHVRFVDSVSEAVEQTWPVGQGG